MSTFNALIYLNAYDDCQSTNNPSMNPFKWTRTINGLTVAKPASADLTLAPGETLSLFSGTRTLTQDGTTEYSIALKQFTTNTYVLSSVGGTAPNFRTPRSIGIDATTQVTITINGPLTIFTSTGGTLFNLASVQVGDNVFIGNNFNILNQGAYQIIALTSTSFTVQNATGVAEGPITLGSGFANQIQIYSSAGVQVGDTLSISGGFSQVTQGSYQITAVYAESLEFSSLEILPTEGPITTEAIAIYSDSKQLIYIESDQDVDLTINGSDGGTIEPFVTPTGNAPGMFLRKATIYSLSVTNTSINTANLFFAAIG